MRRDDQCHHCFPITSDGDCGSGIIDLFKQRQFCHECVRKDGHSGECVCKCGKEWGELENEVIADELKRVFTGAMNRAAERLGISDTKSSAA
jgi:hypothetical protein